MRRWFAIAKATALEIMSEPLSFLLLITAEALVVLAPALHYHQFGEPTRMARDAGLSSLFTFGIIFAVCGVFRSFRREIESGTAQMAISHPVSRGMFFSAKCAGAMAAYAVFAGVLASVSMVMVYGAAVGGAIARQSGDISRVWGPALAAGTGVIIVPPVAAALLNRFLRFRFVLSSFSLAVFASMAAVAFFFDPGIAARLAPAWTVLAFPTAFLVAATAAFTAGLKPNRAVFAIVALVVSSLPAVGNYYLADTLSRTGAVEWSYVAVAMLAALPAVGAFLIFGIYLFERRDIA